MFDWITTKGMVFILGVLILGLQLFLDWRARRLIINDNHALNAKSEAIFSALKKIADFLNTK